MRQWVGNDLVDLQAVGSEGKADDYRFVARVLTKKELASLSLIQLKRLRDRFFWQLWAAKEAAYKVMKKEDPDLFFSHSQYEVDVAGGVVQFKQFSLPTRWSFSEHWVHCVCVSDQSLFSDKKLMVAVQAKSEIRYDPEDFHAYERISVHSHESGQVRQLAKDLLLKNGHDSFQIVRRSLGARFAPPELWFHGKKLPAWDLSLSHDGEYVAACLVNHNARLNS